MLNKNVKNYLDLESTSGTLGIEVEMEFREPHNFSDKLREKWRVEYDGSLRGNCCELVIREPCALKDVSSVVGLITKNLKRERNEIVPSIRAGVHVHINMQDYLLKDVFKFAATYYPLETVLTRFCGEGREGNLFCLRGRDASWGIQRMIDAYQTRDVYKLRTNQLRYSGFNLQSLFLYGSVEFRALGTTKDLKNIELWCEIITRLRDYSVEEGNPWGNIQDISGLGVRGWMEKIFGAELTEILSYPEMDVDVLEDVRNVQQLCYLMRGIDDED